MLLENGDYINALIVELSMRFCINGFSCFVSEEKAMQSGPPTQISLQHRAH